MKHLFFYLLLFLTSSLIAQGSKDVIFCDAKEFTLLGKANATPHYYHRVDTSIYSALSQNTKSLFSNSSGLIIAFKTNSKKIEAKWTLSSYKVGNNMTAIAHSGLDLYIRKDNKWIFAGVGRPSGIKSSSTLVEHMDGEEKECLLYLPLYNTVEDLEIGIDGGSTITSVLSPYKKKIVIYGSSITQGASASRPGMSYTSRIGRALNIEVINLGVSGNGKMEKKAAHLTADVDADMYVLDCAANPSPEEIMERTNYMVKHIRSTHPAKPIVMIESVVRETGNFNLIARDRVKKQNESFEAEYRRLIKEGVKDLYLIKGKDLLGNDHEGTTDGVHPNDIGFSRMIDVIQASLMKILKKY